MNMRESFEAFMALPAPSEDLDLWISPISALIAERVWQAAWTAAAQECARACAEVIDGEQEMGNIQAANGAETCESACNRIAEGK